MSLIFTIVTAVNPMNSLTTDTQECINQRYSVHVGFQEYLIALTEGKLSGSCSISDELQSMNIIELIPAASIHGDILVMTDDHTVYWCMIIDSLLTIITHIAYNVRSARAMGNQLNCMTVLVMGNQLTIVHVNSRTQDRREYEIEVPEGVKWIDGQSDRKNITIVTNTNRLLTLVLDSKFRARELAVIPDLRDIVRTKRYWLAIRDHNQLSIIMTREDGLLMNRLSPKSMILPGVPVPNEDSVLEFDSEIEFTKFLNSERLIDDKGSVYSYNHNLKNGEISLAKCS